MPINNPTPAVRPPRAQDEIEFASSGGMMAPESGGSTALDQGIEFSEATDPVPQQDTTLGQGIDIPPVTHGADFFPTASPAGGAPVPPPSPSGGGVPGGGGGSSPAGGLTPPDYQQPAGVGDVPISGGLTGLANDVLGNVSRFDIPLVREGTRLIDRELADQREGAVAGIEEFNSSRGRTGSTFEAQEMAELASDLETQRMSRLHDLNLLLAETAGEDRRAAADIATQAGMFERLLGQDKVQASQWESQFEHDANMDIAALRQRESEFGQNLQFQREQLGQRESEFARSLGLDTARFQEEQRQFSASHAERIAERMQQDNQFAQSLGLEESKLALERSIQTRSLDLQERGLDMDEAFRQAELELERDIQNRALELEERGMDLDEAYRYAALEQGERGLDQQQQQIDDTQRLSQLDIILRAITSGLDPAEFGLSEDQIMALFS